MNNLRLTVKDKIFDYKFQLMMMFTAALSFMPGIASADTTVGGNVPTVGADGQVTFKGGNGDMKANSTKVLSNGQFIVGLVGAVSGMCLVGFGIWYGFKTSKQIQEGNQQGWGAAGKVVAGTLIGGIIIGGVGLVLSIGAATGKDFFA